MGWGPPSGEVLARGTAEPPLARAGLSRCAFIGDALQVGANIRGGVSNCPADPMARHGADGCHSSQSSYAYVEHVSDFLGGKHPRQYIAHI